MRKGLFMFLLFVSCFAGLVNTSRGLENSPLPSLYDDFVSKDDNKWLWVTYGTGDTELSSKGIKLKLNKNDNKEIYCDSFFSTKATDAQYFTSTAVAKLRKIEMERGSMGFGFWNETMDPEEAAFAFFMFLKGNDDYQLNGFYVITKFPGANFQITPVPVNLLDAWNTYKVDLEAEGSVTYEVNNHKIASHIFNRSNKAINYEVWVDNAVYDPATFAQITFPVNSVSVIEVDWVSISK